MAARARPEIVLPDPWLIGQHRLRPPEIADAEALVETWQVADIQRFTLVPADAGPAEAAAWVQRCHDDVESGDAVRLLITDPPGEALFGMAGLLLDWADGQAETVFWLHPNARGRGIISRAVAELIRFGFGLGLRRISLTAAATNGPSQRVAERLGFTREGRLRQAGIDGVTGDLDGPRVDLLVYGLLPGELVAG